MQLSQCVKIKAGCCRLIGMARPHIAGEQWRWISVLKTGPVGDPWKDQWWVLSSHERNGTLPETLPPLCILILVSFSTFPRTLSSSLGPTVLCVFCLYIVLCTTPVLCLGPWKSRGHRSLATGDRDSRKLPCRCLESELGSLQVQVLLTPEPSPQPLSTTAESVTWTLDYKCHVVRRAARNFRVGNMKGGLEFYSENHLFYIMYNSNNNKIQALRIILDFFHLIFFF